MATIRVFLGFVALFTSSFFCVVNGPPKTNQSQTTIILEQKNEKLKLLEQKIEKLELLEYTVSETIFDHEKVKSFLDNIDPKALNNFKKLKGIIDYHLRLNKSKESEESSLYQALKMLDIPLENTGLMFSKMKNQSEKIKMVNFKNAILDLIKEHLNRMYILKKIQPGQIIRDLNDLLCCMYKISYEDPMIIQVVKSITGTSKEKYKKFVIALKRALKKIIKTKFSDNFPASKTALDHYLIITRAVFIQVMDYKQELERKVMDEAKFGEEFKKSLTAHVTQQILKIQIDIEE